MNARGRLAPPTAETTPSRPTSAQRLTATGDLNRNHLGRYHMSKEAFRAARDLLR